ncbi:MAG: hypothetical protein BWY65_01984 [Firmicutes bacterium ADurb.Bin373]|nr:MAG: hypothetical protein BWY65_01984 [Firmicutes bacterium ADurb.Bin373]
MAEDLVSKNQIQDDSDKVLYKIAKALEGLKYGEVVIKVQGGKVVFVDRYERENQLVLS